MSDTILVTAGNIGDSVVDSLLRKGRKVRIAVRKKQPNPVWDAGGAEQVEFDYARPDTMARAFDGVGAYFSLSPLIQNFFEGALQALTAAKRAGVRRVVRSSALGAAEDGLTFPRWHRVVETALEQSGMAYTILQPTAFMQNYLYYAGSIKQDGKFYAPYGSAKASFIDARDIGEAAAVALTESGHKGKTYRLTGSEAVSSAETATILSEVLGKTVNYVPVSQADAKNAMASMGMPPWMVDGMAELNQVTEQGSLAQVEPGIAQLLGRPPRTFRQFARDFRSAFI
jgi:uncharacterized protein YbjT (DUF2867 family)